MLWSTVTIWSAEPDSKTSRASGCSTIATDISLIASRAIAERFRGAIISSIRLARIVAPSIPSISKGSSNSCTEKAGRTTEASREQSGLQRSGFGDQTSSGQRAAYPAHRLGYGARRLMSLQENVFYKFAYYLRRLHHLVKPRLPFAGALPGFGDRAVREAGV